MSEQEQIDPPATRELAEPRKRLAPKPAEAFKAFSQSVFANGALPAKTKQLIAVAGVPGADPQINVRSTR
jgi:alkylhydroperoxidase/carboxymuconolactone decarboxylase family protein YurZ